MNKKPDNYIVVLSYESASWAIYNNGKLDFEDTGDCDSIQTVLGHLGIEQYDVDEEWFERKENSWPKSFESVKTL